MAGSENVPGLEDLMRFPLLDALFGRRARRFPVGATIPDGVLAYASQEAPMPLSELERMVVLTACGGNTGWLNLIIRNEHYAPHLSNYAGSAGGRTFPSAAGFETSEVFFTDDDGVYVLQTRDAPKLVERSGEGRLDVEAMLDAHRGRIRRIAEGRLALPARPPHFEGHNTWCANAPGSLLVIPVVDLAQHALAGLCYLVQNGFGLHDDVNRCPIPGLAEYGDLIDLDNPWPLSFFDQVSQNEATVEIGCSCYAGMLALQAMGLGGWMFNGLNPLSVLGAGGEPEARGLGFRYDTDDRWAVPNPTGLAGVFEAFCPPHYGTMREAVEALMERKYGPGGPYHPDTPGPYRDTPAVRAAAAPLSERARDCVTTLADYILDRFGKFPATVPSVHAFMYLQAHHLDLGFYDRFYARDAYLPAHAAHMGRWHEGEGRKEAP